MKDDVRKYSTTAEFDVIPIRLSMNTFTDYRLLVIDINEAYLQSGQIRQQIHVRLPVGWSGCTRGHLWKLLKLPYGIIDAERQWTKVLE